MISLTKRANFLFALALTGVFAITAIATLNDYNISWDETIHFRRGQAYLHYFFTGHKNYQNLPVNIRRSFYQNDYHNGEFFMKDDVGHPPLNDILAAFSNYIFYQRLNWMGDIQAYHLFNVLASSFLVFIVTYWLATTFGKFAALAGALSVITYPLFFSESHFNIKDPPEAAFFIATLWAFWYSLKDYNIIWLVIAWVFCGLALGTKFNIIFLPFIVSIYLFYLYQSGFFFRKKKPTKKYYLLLFFGPLISVIILLLCWPYVNQDIFTNLPKILGYYSSIGSGTNYQSQAFYLFGLNFYPSLWIAFTTPPLVLLLSVIGLFSAIGNRTKYNYVSVIWLSLLFVPIVRVSLPNTSLYGGIRQILEFLPALAIIAGLGAWQICEWCKKMNLKYLWCSMFLLLICFSWPVLTLIKMHPNQNVYFNFLIGGLKGAEEKNFPSWGNSFGNAYLQGINWINNNAEYGSKVALVQGTTANAPQILFRNDISHDNSYRSGIQRKGEYLMELTFNDSIEKTGYSWDYVNNFLDPVYQLRVDGTTILKIWKNDVEHTKPGFKLIEKKYESKVEVNNSGQTLQLDLLNPIKLSRLGVDFNLGKCSMFNSGHLETSLDNKAWVKEADLIPSEQAGGRLNLQDHNLLFYFPGKLARYIRLSVNNNSCLYDIKDFEIFYF